MLSLLLRYLGLCAVRHPSSSRTRCLTSVSSSCWQPPRSAWMTARMSSRPRRYSSTTPTTTTTTTVDCVRTSTTRSKTRFALPTFFSPTSRSASCSGSSVRVTGKMSKATNRFPECYSAETIGPTVLPYNVSFIKHKH